MSGAVKLRSVPRLVSEPASASTQSTLDDSQLRKALREGDPAAANAMVLRLAPRVRGTVRRLLGPADSEGDDVVQKSLFEIVQCIESFRGESSLEAWAAAVTAKVVYKHIRRRRLERRVFPKTADDRGVESPSLAVAIDFARHFEARSELARVFVLLRTLDDEKVFPYLLHDVCGFDLREIADIVGTSIAAAQSRLVRGRRLVHDTLAQHVAAPPPEEP
jgi:RNA polymerase sigma-70 factor (ECF subfamily)